MSVWLEGFATGCLHSTSVQVRAVGKQCEVFQSSDGLF